jgi:malonate decarboxylase beta subunit
MTRGSTPGLLTPGQTWETLLARTSFIELDALGRATALADPGSLRVLCGPFERVESPWLEPQGVTPQADDGTVIARARIDGQPVVIASIEQRFLGGGTGEVSGAKISQALLRAVADSLGGTNTPAVILFETGGVRLQEANLGLNAVAEICSAVLDLRPHAPVIGVVAGQVGSFGGMSIVAGLCTRLIATPEARIGLNGPEVIEQEAGIAEFDSSDRGLVWAIDGGEHRHAIGLTDALVPDDVETIRTEVSAAIGAGVPDPSAYRSRRVDVLESRLKTIDPTNPPEPADLPALWGAEYEPVNGAAPSATSKSTGVQAVSRGWRWLQALTGLPPERVIPSVVRILTESALYLAVVPDPDNPYHRAREGQVGLTESVALAQAVSTLIDLDREASTKRAIVAIVDLPSQAYGRIEEMVGLHQALATAVDVYHRARTAGHPVVTIVVGTALSGGFLTHGLQANQILALNDAGVEIHAMHKEAAARITLRTPAQLDALAQTITPMSYQVKDWATLGFCDGLLDVENADSPTEIDVDSVSRAIKAAIENARLGPRDLSNRLDSPGAIKTRQASRRVREVITQQWEGGA